MISCLLAGTAFLAAYGAAGCDEANNPQAVVDKNDTSNENDASGGDDEGESIVTTFFVTSIGNPSGGGDYGGLAGADLHCQTLARNAGLQKPTWRAYLSTVGVNGGERVSARDRIGPGPWHNRAGKLVASTVADLHRTEGLSPALMMDEYGKVLDEELPGAEHDILTGSTTEGTPMSGRTCRDWTSSQPEHRARVGHHDWSDIPKPKTEPQSWHSVHDSPCDPGGMERILGSGRLYCFAVE